ncbi:SDR family oxidoreductase [candidate division WOR-3 bacterium]|nr:SDR family oxidoreductase [candidate division WOR-3 bacterium]
MNSIERKIALITGATSGIGAAFAKRFAEQGYDLIITGRRKEKIESLSNTLSENNINVEVIISELSNDKDLCLLSEKIKKTKNLEILVNNAGFAKKNFFHKEDFSTHEMMLKVHNLALIKLCHAVLPNMVSKGKGIIINVSSLSAFTPFPTNAIYSASKSFVKLFTESIYLELQGTGVKVQVLCPGMTRTDFHEKMGFDKNSVYKDKGIMKAMTPEEVVDISLQYLEKDRVLCVPGGNNKLLTFLLKVLPQAVIYKIAYSMMHKKK